MSSVQDHKITLEDRQRARAKVAGILCGTEANPFVPLHKSARSWTAWGAGIFVTVGNALNNAGQAFFSLGSVAGAPIGGVAAVGTFAAMTKLYGESVLPAFQKMLTYKSQQEEYMALMLDLAMAKELGLDRDTDQLQAFLRRGFQERQAAIARKKFRKDLATRADKVGEDVHNDLNIDELLSHSAQQHANKLGKDFLAVLKKYFAKKNTDLALQESMTTFFEAIYQASQPSLSTVQAAVVLEDKKRASIFDLETETLKELKAAKESKDKSITLDLESAFIEVSTYQQWLWTEQRRQQSTSEIPSTFWLWRKLYELRNWFWRKLYELRNWFWTKWYDVNITTEKEKRVAALKKALGVKDASFDEELTKFGRWALNAATAENSKDEIEAQEILGETHQETERLRERLKYYRRQMAERAYNVSFRAFWERCFAALGQVIGTFGAVGNAALGYLGLKSIFAALGFLSIPGLWITLVVLGMIAGFGSSFLMTRLRIVERLRDLGRYLDKGLPIENRRLRYTVILLGILGSAASAYFAFYAGQILMVSFLGAGTAVFPAVLAFGLVCGVATFFGAGSLMIESLYESLERYVLISEAKFYKDKQERFEAMLRLFFLGQSKPEKISFEKGVQIVLARVLGLTLLVGAIASQIQLGLAPLMIVGTVFAVIGMFALYGGVFEVAEKVVQNSFDFVKWAIKQPKEGAFAVFLGLSAAALLELSITAAAAWISNAAFLGIGASMAPSLFAMALLSFVVVIAILVCQYRAEVAKGKSLEDADKMLSSSSSSSKVSVSAAVGIKRLSVVPDPLVATRPQPTRGRSLSLSSLT